MKIISERWKKNVDPPLFYDILRGSESPLCYVFKALNLLWSLLSNLIPSLVSSEVLFFPNYVFPNGIQILDHCAGNKRPKQQVVPADSPDVETPIIKNQPRNVEDLQQNKDTEETPVWTLIIVIQLFNDLILLLKCRINYIWILLWYNFMQIQQIGFCFTEI